ncbi:MAG: DUF6175 family protein [Candidatus Marinimicrobia bacterium]|nr:DUF6175 family protein [Candidatus Neomarinimicrobiota bacterium]
MKTSRLFMILIFGVSFLMAKSNLPVSREAVLVESTSPSEIMIRATGYGSGSDKASELDKRANNDAFKAAVWFVLFGGSDPLIQTDQEKSAFQPIQEEFFTKENLKQFKSWEADFYDTRLKVDGGKKLKVEKTFKINKALLQEDLVKKGILAEVATVAGSVGLPSIMVIPESKDGKAPLELLKTDSNLKKGAEVIESYLTARKYEVIVPEQQQVLQELSSAQNALQGGEDDYSYLLALSIGSDVYISYNVTIETRKVGSTIVKKGVVGCRAYETTTARLLGTETGYSPERATADAVLIEEAMNDAIDKVLSRITNYWKQDIQQGIQYKLVLSIANTFDKDDAETIIFGFGDLLKQVSKTYKENVVADYTYDVQIWCDAAQYKSSSDIYRFLKQNYKGGGELTKVSVSRKLILLNVADE